MLVVHRPRSTVVHCTGRVLQRLIVQQANDHVNERADRTSETGFRHPAPYGAEHNALTPVHPPIHSEPFTIRLMRLPKNSLQSMCRNVRIWPSGEALF